MCGGSIEVEVLQCALGLAFNNKPLLLNTILESIGGVKQIFNLSVDDLVEYARCSITLAEELKSNRLLDRAYNEYEWIKERGIEILFRGEDNYPQNLMNIADAPSLLFFKGNISFNNRKTISIVGTRLASNYGKNSCKQIINDIKDYNPIIVSGLAYGIDITAHREALQLGLDSVAVLPNGMDIIYPDRHRADAINLVKQGGVITEFFRGTPPLKMNFIKRNRIIAGLADALVIVESRIKGGSMSTVEFANSYNKDIFALPGRYLEANSYGCNYLISKHVAAIYNSPSVIANELGWVREFGRDISAQPNLFTFDIKNKEKLLLSLNFNTPLSVEELATSTNIEWQKLLVLLLELELEGRVSMVNGDEYILVKK